MPTKKTNESEEETANTLSNGLTEAEFAEYQELARYMREAQHNPILVRMSNHAYKVSRYDELCQRLTPEK